MCSYYKIILIALITTFYNFTEIKSRRWMKTEEDRNEQKATHIKNVDSSSNEVKDPKVDNSKEKRKWWPVRDPHGNKYFKFTEYNDKHKEVQKDSIDTDEPSQRQTKEQEGIIEQIKKGIPKTIHALATPNVDYANFWSAVTRQRGTPCTSASVVQIPEDTNLQELNDNPQDLGLQLKYGYADRRKLVDPGPENSLMYQGNNTPQNNPAASHQENGVIYPQLNNTLIENDQGRAQSQQEHPFAADEAEVKAGDDQPVGPLNSEESLMLFNILKEMDAAKQHQTPTVLDVQSNNKADNSMPGYVASPASSYMDQVQSSNNIDYPTQGNGASPSSYINQPIPYAQDYQQGTYGGQGIPQAVPSPCTEHGMADPEYNNYKAGIPNSHDYPGSYHAANKVSNKDYETFEDAWHSFANAYRQYRVQNHGGGRPKKKVFGFKREGPCDPMYSYCDNRKKAYYYTDFKSKTLMRKALNSIITKDYKTFAKSNVWFWKNTVKNVAEAFVKGLRVLSG